LELAAYTLILNEIGEKGKIAMETDIDYKKVGERLQNFREVRGLTRAVVAQRLSISEKDLEDMERGKKKLSPENIEALRETFSLDPAWLLGGQSL
jgi:transcriptional regulator with XRE-family HTH domain